MLKIKDDVDLKELEKFGFKKIEWNENTKPYDQFEHNLATMGIGRKKEILILIVTMNVPIWEGIKNYFMI